MRAMTMLAVGLFILLAGCAAAPYKKASLGAYAGRTGYLDREVGPGKYIVEYSHIGGYNYNLEVNQQYWLKRAAELCPNGYDGEPEVIFAGDAKIDEFVCSQRFCLSYPLVSGVIQCHVASEARTAREP